MKRHARTILSFLFAIAAFYFGIRLPKNLKAPEPPALELSKEDTTQEPVREPSSEPTPQLSNKPHTRNKGNQEIDNFGEAKKLAIQIYRDHPFTFYCDCKLNLLAKKPTIDHASCNYVPFRDLKRASRLEWEHVVPAHDFGRSFVEWRDGAPGCVNAKGKKFRGRKCAQKVSEEFRMMEADLYNLVPEVGEINAMRGDLPMELLAQSEPLTSSCLTKISRDAIEPRPEIRGFVARIYFYMNDAYPNRGIISNKNQKLFQAWNKLHPPDQWEKKRAQKIFNIQKNKNTFVDVYSLPGKGFGF